MKESLETTRSIHQILIFICTVIGVFALSLKNIENKYSAALDELEKLYSVLDSLPIRKIEKIQKELTNPTTAIYLKKHYSATPIFSFDVDQREMLINSGRSLQSIYGIVINSTQMDSIYLPNLVETANKHPTEFSEYLFGRRLDTIKTKTVRLKFKISSSISNMFVELSRPIEDNQPSIEMRDFGVFFLLSKVIYDPSTDYRYQLYKHGLWSNPKDSRTFLPKLLSVWQDVEFGDYRANKQKLQDLARSSETESEVDVSGLKVAGQFMYIIGPFIILALIVYLQMLLNHVQVILDQDRTTPKTFPWFGIFTDRISKIAVLFSITIYPIFVSLFLIWRSNINTVKACWWTVIYFVLFGFFSLLLLRNIYRLQRRLTDDR